MKISFPENKEQALGLANDKGFVVYDITRKSMLSGKVHTQRIELRKADMDEFKNGSMRLIQDIFPYLSAADREFILTGATAEEWNKAFPEEDDAEGDGNNA